MVAKSDPWKFKKYYRCLDTEELLSVNASRLIHFLIDFDTMLAILPNNSHQKGGEFYLSTSKAEDPLLGVGMKQERQRRAFKELEELGLVQRRVVRTRQITVRYVSVNYDAIDEINEEYMERYMARMKEITEKTGDPTSPRGVEADASAGSAWDHSAQRGWECSDSGVIDRPKKRDPKEQEPNPPYSPPRKDKSASKSEACVSGQNKQDTEHRKRKQRRPKKTSWADAPSVSGNEAAHKARCALGKILGPGSSRKFCPKKTETAFAEMLDASQISAEDLGQAVDWGVSNYGDKFCKRLRDPEDLADVVESWLNQAKKNGVHTPEASVKEIAAKLREKRERREARIRRDREKLLRESQNRTTPPREVDWDEVAEKL